MCVELCGSERPRAGGKVLVIDDEPSVADALKMILEDQSFVVVTAATGRAGIEQACRTVFDVVITDLRLPDVDGIDVIAAVRQRGAGGAIILITSHGTEEIFALARERGADGVAAKPFLPTEIIELIAAALAGREPTRACEARAARPATDACFSKKVFRAETLPWDM